MAGELNRKVLQEIATLEIFYSNFPFLSYSAPFETGSNPLGPFIISGSACGKVCGLSIYHSLTVCPFDVLLMAHVPLQRPFCTELAGLAPVFCTCVIKESSYFEGLSAELKALSYGPVGRIPQHLLQMDDHLSNGQNAGNTCLMTKNP